MAFKQVQDLDAETTIALGGRNKKTGKANPTEVEGYYLGKRKVESKKAKSGFAFIYYFQTPKGNVGVWGKTDLDRKMEGVTPGLMVRASFSKMVPTPNGEMYKFLVEFDPDNTIEVATLSAGAGNDTEDSNTYTGSSVDTLDEEEGYSNGEDTDEDAAQSAALAAAEAAQRARVQAILKGNKSKTVKG